jgi:hypothetical protein
MSPRPSKPVALSCVGLVLWLGAACSGAPENRARLDGGEPPVVDGGEPPVVDGGTDAGQPMDSGPASAWMEAPFPSIAQVPNSGGAVLSAPKVVSVFFSNDNAGDVTQIKDFLTKLAPSAYWREVGQEYGVGAPTNTFIELTESATGMIDDSGDGSPLQTWLAAKISMQQVPAPDSNTIYSLHYPAGVVITDGSGSSCADFGGYHSDMQLANGTKVAYAVIPRCDATMNSTVIQQLTVTESHELIEAATDPYPHYSPAYAAVDDAHLEFDIAYGGSEVGDMCENDAQPYLQSTDLPYMVQRSWSNKSARAGHDPCVPAFDGEVYFNTTPELNDDISFSNGPGQPATITKGVRIPVGSSKTITLDAFSEAATSGPWTIQVQDASQFQNNAAPNMTFKLDKTSVQNGDKVQLTITPTKAGQNSYDLFFVICTLGQDQFVSIGLVGE